MLFFFQAEDGIRDGRVTGVQTCALPILAGLVNNAGIGGFSPLELTGAGDFRRLLEVNVTGQLAVTQAFLPLLRSEEHTSELQSPVHLVCRLLLEKKKSGPVKIFS